MTNEMVERVARTIAAAIHPGVDCWRSYESVARKAIAAMREPSGPMVNAAWSAPGAFRDIELGRGSGIKSVYSAMIDEALTDD